ncbi:MAG: hypothetical protein ACXACC_10425 [Promethearchaeota archaeon]|jgi:flagellar hook-associated protein FlgK
MGKLIKISEEINTIKGRIEEIYKILDIYNINDVDSINSIKEELKTYTDRLKKITDEELK